MPTDLLLPAFALTLAVNAVLILMAIRAMRAEPGPRSVPNQRPRAVAADPPPATGGTEVELRAGGSAEGRAPARLPSAAATPPGPVPAEPPAATPPSASPAETPVETTASAPVATTPEPQPKARGGRRRKFSLPPLEDHEKVTRSIETFLAGSDALPAAANDGGSAPAPATPVVTVAAIQLLGGSGRDVLERTVRSTARATDTVTVDRRGRVRVVLAGSGELAARAYLRRIRAIIEPVLEADDPTSRVVTATATELDGAVATARRRADRRLTVALRAAAETTGRSADDVADPDELDDLDDLDEPEPRAAGD